MEETEEEEFPETETSTETAPARKSAAEKSDYSIYTQKELEKLMNDALANEDYEKAAAIRDELNKREK